MNSSEFFVNVFLMGIAYIYAGLIIVLTKKMNEWFPNSQKITRKFMHAMMGNFPFIIPFFTATLYPVLVAATFVVLTVLASPYSPSEAVSRRLKTLAEVTEEGHSLGLIFYTISYTILTVFFASKPYVMAAGILPMAYGDSAASLIGERYGRKKYKLIATKSLEGSVAMFGGSFLSITLSLGLFSWYYSFSWVDIIIPTLMVTIVVTIIESASPMGTDNLTVPTFGALTFLLMVGGL